MIVSSTGTILRQLRSMRRLLVSNGWSGRGYCIFVSRANFERITPYCRRKLRKLRVVILPEDEL